MSLSQSPAEALVGALPARTELLYFRRRPGRAEEDESQLLENGYDSSRMCFMLAHVFRTKGVSAIWRWLPHYQNNIDGFDI
jgi:hypothetical protein